MLSPGFNELLSVRPDCAVRFFLCISPVRHTKRHSSVSYDSQGASLGYELLRQFFLVQQLEQVSASCD